MDAHNPVVIQNFQSTLILIDYKKTFNSLETVSVLNEIQQQGVGETYGSILEVI